MKKFVFPENKSVNDFKVIGGIKGDEAIEPGVAGGAGEPPTCFVVDTGGEAATGSFDVDAEALRRKLRFFFDILWNY